MQTQPSNAVLLEKIEHIQSNMSAVNKHLEKLNGTVAKNNKDIILVKNIYTFIFPLATLVIGFLVNSIIS